MTPRLDDDPQFVNFLRQHHPLVPPASPNLEDEILAAVQTTPLERRVQRRSIQLRHRAWLVPSAIAAGLIAGIVSYRALTPAQPNATEVANLESFIESSWYGTVSDNSDGEWYPTADSTAN